MISLIVTTPLNSDSTSVWAFFLAVSKNPPLTASCTKIFVACSLTRVSSSMFPLVRTHRFLSRVLVFTLVLRISGAGSMIDTVRSSLTLIAPDEIFLRSNHALSVHSAIILILSPNRKFWIALVHLYHAKKSLSCCVPSSGFVTFISAVSSLRVDCRRFTTVR